jgi:outer membrane protein assembly factor BamD (BamD/ComL family)
VFLEKGDKKKAADRLREIVADHPDTPEAKEAAELLEGIGEK